MQYGWKLIHKPYTILQWWNTYCQDAYGLNMRRQALGFVPKAVGIYKGYNKSGGIDV